MNLIDAICSSYKPSSETVVIRLPGGFCFVFKRETSFAETKRLRSDSREFAETIFKGLDKAGEPIYACPASRLTDMVPDYEIIAQCRVFEQQCLEVYVQMKEGDEKEPAELPSVWDFMRLSREQGVLFATLVADYSRGQMSGVIEGEARRVKEAKKNSENQSPQGT